jgi:hypothetical protein
MLRDYEDKNSDPLVMGLFCEPFSAAEAIRALTEQGFLAIDLIGALNANMPDLTRFLSGIGVPPGDARYYNDSFEDGAVLVMVRTPPSKQSKVAREILRRWGGNFPAES